MADYMEVDEETNDGSVTLSRSSGESANIDDESNAGSPESPSPSAGDAAQLDADDVSESDSTRTIEASEKQEDSDQEDDSNAEEVEDGENETTSDFDQDSETQETADADSYAPDDSVEPSSVSALQIEEPSGNGNHQDIADSNEEFDQLLPPKLVIDYPFNNDDTKGSSIVDSVKSRTSKKARLSKSATSELFANIPGPLKAHLTMQPLMDSKPEHPILESSRPEKTSHASEEVHFPPKTVRRIMFYLTGNHDIRVSHPSVRAVSVAMESFISEFAKEAFRHTQRKGRSVIRYEDVAYVGNHFSSLYFLQDYLPPVRKAADVVTSILENAGIPLGDKGNPLATENGSESDLPSAFSHISPLVQSALELKDQWNRDAESQSVQTDQVSEKREAKAKPSKKKRATKS